MAKTATIADDILAASDWLDDSKWGTGGHPVNGDAVDNISGFKILYGPASMLTLTQMDDCLGDVSHSISNLTVPIINVTSTTPSLTFQADATCVIGTVNLGDNVGYSRAGTGTAIINLVGANSTTYAAAEKDIHMIGDLCMVIASSATGTLYSDGPNVGEVSGGKYVHVVNVNADCIMVMNDSANYLDLAGCKLHVSGSLHIGHDVYNGGSGVNINGDTQLIRDLPTAQITTNVVGLSVPGLVGPVNSIIKSGEAYSINELGVPDTGTFVAGEWMPDTSAVAKDVSFGFDGRLGSLIGPNKGDVRKDTNYGINESGVSDTGILAVPSPSDVRKDAPTDATLGTLDVTALESAAATAQLVTDIAAVNTDKALVSPTASHIASQFGITGTLPPTPSPRFPWLG